MLAWAFRVSRLSDEVNIVSDGDIFCRAAARGWRPVAKALRDRVDPEIAGLAIAQCLARQLRETGGLGAFDVRRDLERLGATHEMTRGQVISALELQARRSVVDKVIPLMVGGGFAHVEAKRYVRACLDSAGLDAMAGSLIQRPTAARFRRPPLRRLALDDLLKSVAPLGANA